MLSVTTAHPAFSCSKAKMLIGTAFVLLNVHAAVAQADLRAFWQGPPPNRAVRLAQAQDWQRGFSVLDGEVPTLSPAESAWLRREYDEQIAGSDGKFTPRALAAMESREFHVRRAREHLDVLLPVVARLSSSKSLDERAEITDWARIAALIADGPFWSSVEDLKKRGLVNSEVNGVKDFLHQTHSMWASVVITRVVVPYLERAK